MSSGGSTDLCCVASESSSNSTVPVYLLQQYRNHGGSDDFYDKVEEVRSFLQDAAQLAAEEQRPPWSDILHILHHLLQPVPQKAVLEQSASDWLKLLQGLAFPQLAITLKHEEFVLNKHHFTPPPRAEVQYDEHDNGWRRFLQWKIVAPVTAVMATVGSVMTYSTDSSPTATAVATAAAGLTSAAAGDRCLAKKPPLPTYQQSSGSRHLLV